MTTTAGLFQSLLAVQAEAPTLQKSAINPHFKSRFVPLEEVHEAVMPILNKHGLAWVTLPGVSVGGSPVLRYRLIHADSGDEIKGTMPLLPAKADPQGQGSAITYARRYALMAVLGLVADIDDDGNAASTPAKKRPVNPNLATAVAISTDKAQVLADQVAALPGTVELLGKGGADKIKKLRTEVGVAPATLRAHVVGTHSKDNLEELTVEEGQMVSLWLESKKAKAA